MICDLLTEPSNPEELTVEIGKVTETAVTLSWKEPNPPDPSILKYEIQYRKYGEDSFTKKEYSLTCHCAVNGLTAYTKYEFRVAAINSAGCGTFTDVVAQFTSKLSMQKLLFIYLWTVTLLMHEQILMNMNT